MPQPIATFENDVEMSVGPHSRRPGWRVARIIYRGTDEQARRISEVLALLTAPADEQPSGGRAREDREASNAVD
jgi:hypothetical protein